MMNYKELVKAMSTDLNIINLTPYEIDLYLPSQVENSTIKEGEKPIRVFPSQGIAKCSVQKDSAGTIQFTLKNGLSVPVKVYETVYGDIEGLPPMRPCVDFFIVNINVANAVKESGEFRNDLLIVNPIYKDHERIICSAFEVA